MIQKCDKCGKNIGLNEAYVAITYNLQSKEHDIAKQQDYIDIKHSEIVMVLCGRCGNQNSAMTMTNAVALKNVVYNEIPNPQSRKEETLMPDVFPPEDEE